MQFNLQPTLENELVRLRPLLEEDYEPLYQVAKDPLIWEQHFCFDRYKREQFTTFFNDSSRSKGALVVIDKAKDQIIGSSRYKKIQGVNTAIEIGWSFLARAYWGGRYNKSVKSLMIDHAFRFVDTVIFYIRKDNIRSQKAVEKLGAVRITTPLLVKESDVGFTYGINRKF